MEKRNYVVVIVLVRVVAVDTLLPFPSAPVVKLKGFMCVCAHVHVL